MSYGYSYDPVALQEYKKAISWYLERSEMATDNFIKAIKGKIAVICKDPLRYRNTYKKFRETSLKQYPYSVVYLIDDVNKMILIVSVYHHKRSPCRKYRKT